MAISLSQRLFIGSQHLANQVFNNVQAVVCISRSFRHISCISSVTSSDFMPSPQLLSGSKRLARDRCYQTDKTFASSVGFIGRQFSQLGHHSGSVLNLQEGDHPQQAMHMRWESSKTNPEKARGLPSEETLRKVQNLMTDQISQFFSDNLEYRAYSKDFIFENNWDASQPYTTVGLTAYALKVVKARIYLNSKYARLKMKVLGSSIHEDRGCVCIRWQFGGHPQRKSFMFWRFVPFSFRKTADKELEWYDGLSTFSVNPKGFIFKHRIDKVVPEQESSEQNQEEKSKDGSASAAV